MITDFDAIILAGGRGSRLGGVSKPDLVLDGRRLLDVALDAVAGARQRVVVGPVAVPSGVLRTREEPPYGGPVAGTEAGFAALAAAGHATWTLLLASDLPGAEAAVAALLTAEPGPEVDGCCLAEPDGRLQWLLGCYRSVALARRLSQRGNPPLTALHRLLSPLRLVPIDPGEADLSDVDTPEDAGRWGGGIEAAE